ncbi:MAG: phosphotransferase [Desulfobacterales bacterium]|nr:phosphotransferase [Desulfobacterales bacterium]
MQYDYGYLKKITEMWGIDLAGIRNDIKISGSPERCEFRIVLENEQNKLFLLENIFLKTLNHKKKIARTLNTLSQNDIDQVNPYIADNKGDHIVAYGDTFWQISPFIRGIELNRPEYVFEKWRGKVMADFLIDLKKQTENPVNLNFGTPFSIVDYIYKLLKNIEKHEPELRIKLQSALSFLESELFEIHDSLPIAFCHGDYHPVNIIWGDHNINAVIDWEFLGNKPEIYDVANMIGCLGMEDPECLAGELIYDFISSLKRAGFVSDISWKYLIEYIVAIRFAWMSEWLRKADEEMISLETVYINLLIDNRKDIFHLFFDQ